MKVIVAGSRTFTDYNKLKQSISDNFDISTITQIISGGATGADTLAEQFATENNIEPIILKPEWDKFGKSAGYRRNKDIIDNCDVVIAFWNGESPGTKHSINIATKQNKKTIIIKF